MAKILVVDDELFYRELVSDVLKKAKHDVVQAKDGKDALDCLAKHKDLEVILCDVVMPGFDGIAVLSRINKKDPTIPVIMLSAHEDQRMVLNALRRGAFDYQKKPISAQELAHTVDKAVEWRKLQSAQHAKLARLANLEEGAKRISEMVVGEIRLEAIAKEYELLDSTVKMVSEVLECERVSIMLLNPKDKTLEVTVSIGMTQKLQKHENRPASKSVSSHVLETGEALLVNDVDEDDRVEASDYSKQYKTNSFMVAPLRVGERIVGTINANDKKDGEAFTEDDLLMLRTMSYHVSAALSHAIHSSQMERDRGRLKRLADFQKILMHYLEPQDMMKDLLRNCQDALNVASASIFLLDEESGELKLRLGFNGKNELTRELVIGWGHSITGLTAKNGRIFLLNTPERDKRYLPGVEWPYKGKIKNLLSAPLKVNNQTIGVIRLLNRRDGDFIQDDATLLKDVADSLSIAIRNMKLYEQLNHSVEEIIATNRKLQEANDELAMKARELDALKKRIAAGGRK